MLYTLACALGSKIDANICFIIPLNKYVSSPSHYIYLINDLVD